jgi:ParB family transcriptional regulator, chromosome partitioning protein
MRKHLHTYLQACREIEPLESRLLTRSPNEIRSDLGDVSELSESIKLHGLLQPILVRPRGSRFEIVCGNRRFEACKRLMKRQVECVVKELTDSEAFELSIIENVQRRTLSVLEEAEAYNKYVERFGWGGVADLARKIGKSEEYVSHRIVLLKLPQQIKTKLESGEVSATLAQEVAWIKNPGARNSVLSILEKRKLSISEIRAARRQLERESQADRQTDVEEANNNHRAVQKSEYASKSETDRKALEDSILAMRIALVRLDSIIDGVDNSCLREQMMSQRYALHRIVDDLIKLKLGIKTAPTLAVLAHQER